MNEMVVLNGNDCADRQNMDDSVSNAGTIKSSVADSEYRPMAQLTGIVLFLVLYLLMWASGACSIAPPLESTDIQLDIILSYLYMILCIILGIFLLVFYCLARNDTRATWNACCKPSQDATILPPRSNTNINIITRTNAHNSLRRDDESDGSFKDSSVNDQSNPLLQIMQYHKNTAMISYSVADSQARGDPSVHGSPEDAPVFFNPRQNGVAKRYWERKRTSQEKGMNSSMHSVGDTNRLQAHSPTNTEPTQHMSIEIQIKSHSSKQAKRHRLGSTNSEPPDVSNNIYHSMPKNYHINMPLPHSSRREPTIGQSKTPSETSREMWQQSVPREYNLMVHRASPSPSDSHSSYRKPHQQYKHRHTSSQHNSYAHSYSRSMKHVDDSDDGSQYSRVSKRSSQQGRQHRHRRHRQPERQLNESRSSLHSRGVARSHHLSPSATSSKRTHSHREAAEAEHSLLPTLSLPVRGDEEEKLNINHSSSDNNSSHYACAPIHETKELNHHRDIHQLAIQGQLTRLSPQLSPQPDTEESLRADAAISSFGSTDLLRIPEERIYENVHKIMQHEEPVYKNLENLRQEASVKQAAISPAPTPIEYELPVYENLFSLNEYDTLKKQKHNVNKGLPSLNKGSTRNLQASSNLQPLHNDSSL